MAKQIDVILYKVATEEFTEEKISNWRDYSKLLECSTFDIVAPDENISLYVDDEGLLKDGNGISQVTLPDGRKTKLAGNIVIAGGTDRDGDTLSFEGGLELAKKMISKTDLIVG